MNIILRFRRAVARRRLKRLDTDLYNLRRLQGALIMTQLLTGVSPPPEVHPTLEKDLQRVSAICDKLGAFLGIEGPFGADQGERYYDPKGESKEEGLVT